MHIGEPSLGRFAEQRQEQGAAVILSIKTLPQQGSRKQNSAPNPTAQQRKSW